MTSPEGQIVELTLITGDDALAAQFVNDLETRGAENPVVRHESFEVGIDHLGGASGTAAERTSGILILDLRNSQRAGIRFLNELHNRHPYSEPVVFTIGAGDFEAEIMQAHARYVAGQLPEDGAGAAFVDGAALMLSDNWSFEDVRT